MYMYFLPSCSRVVSVLSPVSLLGDEVLDIMLPTRRSKLLGSVKLTQISEHLDGLQDKGK